MFFSFGGFITKQGFFLKCLENIVYFNVYDDTLTLKMT